MVINNGEIINEPSISDRRGSEFIGWDHDLNNITGDLVITAKYKYLFPEGYILLSDDDFDGLVDGKFVYNGNLDYVIVPEYIKGVKVTKIYSNYIRSNTGRLLSLTNMFMHHLNLKGVYFENIYNITDLSFLFSNNESTEIDVSHLDTKHVTNMSFMFNSISASNIKGLENLNTSNVKSMFSMFSESENLNIDVKTFDTSKVTDMSKMFLHIRDGSVKGFEHFNTSNVENMSFMFADAVISDDIVDLSNYDTSKVTNMSSMFSSIEIEFLDLSHFDTSNVTNMIGMFSFATIKNINLSNFNTSNVVDMSYMFMSLKTNNLDISSFNTSNVKNMSYMFADFGTINTLDLSHFDTSNVENMNYMFNLLRTFGNLDISSFTVNKKPSITNMFSGIYVTKIYVKNEEVQNYFNEGVIKE